MLLLVWTMSGDSVVPAGSLASRPEAAIWAKRPVPATLALRDAWPWPFIAIDGIQKYCGLETAVSNSVPDWTSDGVVSRVPS